MIDIYYYCYYIANRKIFILRNITYKNIKNRLRYLKNKANLCLNPIVNIFLQKSQFSYHQKSDFDPQFFTRNIT